MTRRRIVAIGLDGLDIGFAERLMAAGEMPALDELRRRAACFRLSHGPAQRSGLAWEQFASGLSPEDGRRWAAVEFDPATYRTWQEGGRFTPWWAGLDRRVVVFDTPYVDLRRAPETRGIVGWGAHDPGTDTASRPAALLAEFNARFGAYAASPWTYAIPFPSTSRTQAMGVALSDALTLRARAARWIATERFPDWDVFLVVATETHSAVEGLWHGVDPAHPWHGHSSAPVAGEALRHVHRALDRMLGHLSAAWQDATIVAFNLSGMGPNTSDVASMILLPELLYRHSFGRPLAGDRPEWADAPRAVPIPNEKENWSTSISALVPTPADAHDPLRAHALRALARRLPRIARRGLDLLRGEESERRPHAALHANLEWQPAVRYRPHWPAMQAFALPSFYDGRIRLNLRGRERHGVIEPSAYEETCRQIEALVRDCRDPRTGEPAVHDVERASTRDPLALANSESDLLVVWRGAAAALEHPRLGRIGPFPLRRTGGHTGPHGFAYVAAPGVEPGSRGVRSSFDVVPTLISLLGVPPPAHVSGRSLL